MKKILCSLKCPSPGPDDVHSKILKNLTDELAIPLSVIFTNSFNLPTLPSVCKKSYICPIYKGAGSRFLSENCRPVALTSIACKIMETVIKDILLSHLTSESLISPFQHGFLPGRSTLSALLSATFDWLPSFRTGSRTHCIFFNLSKAIDPIAHRKLLWKLFSYSIHSQCRAWIKDFLSDRTQTIKLQ